MASLGDHYRHHGESSHLRPVEDALTDNWASTADVAERAHVSRKYAEKALLYLLEERRAARRKGRMEKPVRGQRWRWEWKRP